MGFHSSVLLSSHQKINGKNGEKIIIRWKALSNPVSIEEDMPGWHNNKLGPLFQHLGKQMVT